MQPSSRANPNAPQLWLPAEQLARFAAADTDAHRLFTSPQAWIERFGDDLLLSYKDDFSRADALSGLAEWEQLTGFRHRRLFGKFIPMHNEERVAPVLIEGDGTAPLATIVRDSGTQFGVDFSAGYSAGLFIDQRANRALVRQSGGGRVLNTFAYTCSFSVVGALAGGETVSIDLSRKSLDRGRANFALNALDPAGHRFIADDVVEVLPRLARRGERFDLIVLDPPTFSRGNQGRRFQVERDFEALLVSALELAAPRARILLSTNCTRLSGRALEGIARFAFKATRRSADFHTEPPLPDFPRETGAQTLWLFLRN
ncbi:MAG: SAM-dependent methyltransferase-like protein [Chthoniobacter sp.]|nr:SAM-dependent methyltransferase-like protein [Chthoniobacter sp.]